MKSVPVPSSGFGRRNPLAESRECVSAEHTFDHREQRLLLLAHVGLEALTEFMQGVEAGFGRLLDPDVLRAMVRQNSSTSARTSSTSASVARFICIAR
jgi:hypothetical protein